VLKTGYPLAGGVLFFFRWWRNTHVDEALSVEDEWKNSAISYPVSIVVLRALPAKRTDDCVFTGNSALVTNRCLPIGMKKAATQDELLEATPGGLPQFNQPSCPPLPNIFTM
jgi:hypothetical protein